MDGKTAFTDRDIQKIKKSKKKKKWLPIALLNRFLYSLSIGFHQQERKLWIKNNTLRFRQSGWKTLSEIYETMKQNDFPWPKNQFPPARISFVLNNSFPFIAEMVFDSRKKLSSKVKTSIREKNPCQWPEWRIRSKLSFRETEKKLFPAGVSEKIYKKWFVLDRKSVSTTMSEAFVEKLRLLYMEKLFLLAKK